jgi:RNA polymerase primary sigma factor
MSQDSDDTNKAKNSELEVLLGKCALPAAFKVKVRMLVLLSERNGFVSVQDINEYIPDSETDPELIEEIMNILDHLDIKLLDEDEIELYRKKVEESEAKSAKKPRSYDPLDRYNAFFTKLRYEPLLKSAEVNELAKRIEESEQRGLDSLFSCGLTLPFQIELGLKLLRRDEPLAEFVAIKMVESLEAYYKMLPKVAMDCTMLKAKLDKAWQKYLEETDLEKKSRIREAYRKIELSPDQGCKGLLRKFSFKPKVFQEWLEGPELKSDIEDAIQIASAFSASSVQSSAGPAGWQSLYINRARDIERRWRLSAAELAHLVRNVRKHMDDADKARDKMVQYHSLLVSLIAESYQDCGVPLAELMEAGNDSLRETIDDYNYSKGLSFTHFAATGIRFTLLSLIAKKAGIASVALDDLEFIEIIPEVHAELRDELGRDPSVGELANEMNIAIDVVSKLLMVPRLDGLSFSHLSRRGAEFAAPMVESNTPSPGPLAEVFRLQLERILNTLEQREKEVIVLRFGLLDGVLRNYEEVARHFNLSREEIRAIESSAFRKMRHPTLIRRLQGMFGDDVS